MRALYFVIIFTLTACGHNRIRFGPKHYQDKRPAIEVNKNNLPPRTELEEEDLEIRSLSIIQNNEHESKTAGRDTEPEERPYKKIADNSIDSQSYSNHITTDKEGSASDYHDEEASSKFRTSIILMSLGILTIGFTYVIGLVVFIVGSVHYRKSKKNNRKTKIRFRIALALAILIPIIAACIAFALSSVMFSSITVNLGF